MKPISTFDGEEAILSRFLIAYKKKFDVELIKQIHRDKPDFVVMNPITQEYIGVEVTGAYQNAEEAKIQYGKIKDWDRFEGISDDLINSLNDRIADKVTKLYSYNFSGRILLVIWWGSLVFFEKSDIDFIKRKINIPENNYSEIWLIIRENENYSPMLYPLQIENNNSK